MATPFQQVHRAALEKQLAANRQKLAAAQAEYNHAGSVKTFASESERAEFARIQAQFNRPRQAHKLVPVIEKRDESAMAYLARNVECLAPYAADKALRAPLDPTIVKAPEKLVLRAAEVLDSAMEAAHAAPDLRPIVERDSSGREITEFVGAKKSWMNIFEAPVFTGPVMVDGQVGSF
jgi:hypothetical protein